MKLLIFVTLLTIFSSGLASAAIVAGQYFDRIVTVIFENQDYSKAIEDTYLKSLYKSSQGLLLTSYDAAKNYVAMIYGSTDGATDDGDFNLPGQNLVDLLEAKSITWKAYMENYSTSMRWFQGWFDSRKDDPKFNMNTLFFFVWDKAATSGSNKVAAVLYGIPVSPPPNKEDPTAYNHYSFLASVEQNWNLGNLGRNDATATPFNKYLVRPASVSASVTY
ncbi:hypothetical protein C2G38_2153505 [Gigaspora rosea]|uniref:Phosphoesterase family-domain-containing protein n=1 Tax=Gigaspora rosea TaxID=44941 RepID=A0A397W9M1_9GLOM|nr:hypothetical protein C2G38_2153505 [Gigaspora rosea]